MACASERRKKPRAPKSLPDLTFPSTQPKSPLRRAFCFYRLRTKLQPLPLMTLIRKLPEMPTLPKIAANESLAWRCFGVLSFNLDFLAIFGDFGNSPLCSAACPEPLWFLVPLCLRGEIRVSSSIWIFWQCSAILAISLLGQNAFTRIQSVLRRDSVLLFGNPQLLSNIHIQQQASCKSQQTKFVPPGF